MCSLLSPPTLAWNIKKLTFYISPYFWYIVKNRFRLFDYLFISADAYTQVLLTRLTFIDKMQLLLRPYIFDKFLLDTFHSWDTKKVFCTWVERECVWMTLIHFCHCQMTDFARWLLLSSVKCVRIFWCYTFKLIVAKWINVNITDKHFTLTSLRKNKGTS